MTHTLHRKGLAENESGEEIVFLCMIPASERGKKTQEMKQMAETVLRYQPVNIIFEPLGVDRKRIIELTGRGTIITAVFTDKAAVGKLVQEIKSKKLGISVVLSGLFEDVHDICSRADLKEHTYNISLGVHGKTEKLPDEKTLQITTQCGHALISPHYVRHVVNKIKKGKISSEEGADLLIKPCVCGIGNPCRIRKTLDEMAGR